MRSGEGLLHAGAAAGGVELLGGLGVGVIVEQAVEHREGVGVGLSCLPGVERDRDREAGASGRRGSGRAGGSGRSC